MARAKQGRELKFEAGSLTRCSLAFTLVELLVVISIIGLLAALALPAFKGFGESNSLIGAQRQMLDDLGQARLRALNERTTVYMVFIPPGIFSHYAALAAPREKTNFVTLLRGQYTSYSFFTSRSVGEQPGHVNPRYLAEWKSLPEGIFFPKEKFARLTGANLQAILDPKLRPFPFGDIPYPMAASAPASMPYIAFNSLGQLTSGRDEIIPLGKGSIFYNDPLTKLPDVVDPQPNNRTYVRINWLTGRAKIEKPEIR